MDAIMYKLCPLGIINKIIFVGYFGIYEITLDLWTYLGSVKLPWIYEFTLVFKNPLEYKHKFKALQ